MSDDADFFKNQIRNLEQANAELSAKMGNFEEKKLALLKLAELNEFDKVSLSNAFMDLRTRLNVRANDNAVLRDRVARLERELEIKQKSELELKKMIQVNNHQNKEIQELQNRLKKAHGLEETVNRQEIVIEKLENFINKLIRENRSK